MPKPTISVGIPYTDQGSILAEAITSVLGQTYQDWELILYGDGPDEETESVARSFTDPRIRHIVKTERQGLAIALNTMAEESSADLVARMDGDDIMHPRRLEAQLAAFQSVPSLDVVGTRAFLIDEKSNLVGVFKEPPLPTKEADFLASNAFTHPTVMGKRSWFLANKYDESLLRGQDKELWLRTGGSSQFLKLDDALLYYRVSREHSWRRQARNSAYDRKIQRSYSHMANGATDLCLRRMKSYIKQGLVFAITKSGNANLIYKTKYSPLNGVERRNAANTLKEILASSIPAAPKVLAVTVTYGQRLDLVTKTVAAALAAGADKIVVVDNGMAMIESAALAQKYEENKSVVIHRLENNEGSATGFHAGLLSALDSKYNYFLLLDDDNLLVRGTVTTLVKTLLQVQRTEKIAGVSAVRNINQRHRKILQGYQASAVYPPNGAFLYFDVVQNLKQRLKGTPAHSAGATAKIPTAPYGGLLVDRSTLEVIGLPNTTLGLYEDDTEWTSRISRLGGLHLCSLVEVDDLEGKFSEDNDGSGPKRLLCAQDKNRVYFAVRNRVHWERSMLSAFTSKFRYRMNRRIYLTILFLTARRVNAALRYKEILSAIRSAESGNLDRIFSISGPVE